MGYIAKAECDFKGCQKSFERPEAQWILRRLRDAGYTEFGEGWLALKLEKLNDNKVFDIFVCPDHAKLINLPT